MHITTPEWRDEQAGSLYPFVDTATLTSDSGFSFDIDTFIDAHLFPVGPSELLFLTRAVVGNRKVTLYVGDVGSPYALSATFDPVDPPDNLRMVDKDDRAGGVLVSEASRLAVFQGWPSQEHVFQPTASQFLASVVSPMPDVGVRGFVLETGEVFTGDVWFAGSDGVTLGVEDGNTIVFHAVGDPLFLRRECEDTGVFSSPSFVRTINGLRPDANGDFKLTVGDNLADDTILRIYPNGDELKIEVVGQQLKE